LDRTEHVKAFFEDTDLYLKNNYGIAFRRDIINTYTGGKKFSNILDVGCGDSSLSHFLLNESNGLTLVDISQNMLTKAELKFRSDEVKRVKFICGEIDAQNFQDEKFDLILAVGILAHVPSVKGMIEKLSSLLNKGGFLIIQFTDHSNFLSRFNSTIRKMNGTGQYQVNKTRHEEVIKLLDDNHFSIRQMDRYSILLPGFGRFGSKFLYRYTHFTHRTFLSAMGTDVLLLAQKV